MLGEVIGKVFSSLLAVQAELVLFDTAAHPVETHIKGFGALPVHVSGEDAAGGRAVVFDWGGRLRVDHFGEVRAYGNSLLDVEENCSSFGFYGGSHDGVDSLPFVEYWSIRG